MRKILYYGFQTITKVQVTEAMLSMVLWGIKFSWHFAIGVMANLTTILN